MTDFVRVKLDNGAEASVTPEFAKLHKLTVLDDKEGARYGVALDPKYPVRKSKPPAQADSTTKEK